MHVVGHRQDRAAAPRAGRVRAVARGLVGQIRARPGCRQLDLYVRVLGLEHLTEEPGVLAEERRVAGLGEVEVALAVHRDHVPRLVDQREPVVVVEVEAAAALRFEEDLVVEPAVRCHLLEQRRHAADVGADEVGHRAGLVVLHRGREVPVGEAVADEEDRPSRPPARR
jgi:hypothetical protein